MPNPLALELLWPRLARYAGRPDRFPGRWPDTRVVQLASGSARVWDSGGPGPVLVWMPDPPVVIECYGELVSRLVPGHRLVLVELPGIGFGVPYGGFQFGVASVAAALVDLLARLDLVDVTLVGTCLGGYAAKAAAAAAPARVRRLVLLQTPEWSEGQAWMTRRDPDGLLRRPWVGQAAFQLLARSRVDRWFRYALADPRRAGEFAPLSRTALAHGACFCLPSLFQQYLDPRQAPPPTAAVPTLLVAGLADRSYPATDWRTQLEPGTGRRVVVLEGVAHFPDLEAAATLSQLLQEFLRSAATPPAQVPPA